MKFRKNRGIFICLDIRSSAIDTPLQYARLNQCRDLPLQAGDSRPDVIGDFAEIPPLSGLKQSRGEDTLAGGRHQCVKQSIATHNALILTHYALVVNFGFGLDWANVSSDRAFSDRYPVWSKTKADPLLASKYKRKQAFQLAIPLQFRISSESS